MKQIFAILVALALAMLPALAEANDLYAIPVVDGEGVETTLDMYRGKVLLIVNTATKCGFTPAVRGFGGAL